MATQRSVRIYSDYMAWPHVFNAVAYEFVSVLAQVEAATVIATPPKDLTRKLDKIRHKVSWQASRSLGIARPPRAMPSRMDERCDVFVFVGAIMDTLGELAGLSGWRERSGLKVAYIIEAWSAVIGAQKPYIEILKSFDHIFTVHKQTAPLIEKATGVPCSFLPTATDVTKSVPYPIQPARTIDVLSIGRRLDSAHEALLTMARAGEIHYEFDSIRVADTPVLDWSQHRFLTFDRIKRSQFFTCYNHRTAGAHKAWEAQGEQVIPARMFEGAAGGAVMIGSAPDCPEFDQIFGWPDAVVELPEEASRLPDFLRDLGRQSDRLAAARRNNISETVRAHDWSHRWAGVLDAIGLEASPGLTERRATLAKLANNIQATFREQPRKIARGASEADVSTLVQGGELAHLTDARVFVEAALPQAGLPQA